MKLQKLLIILMLVAIYLAYKHSTFSTEVSPFKRYAQIIPGTYRVGYTNLDQEVSLEKLPIKGTIPEWLSGTLLRNGPAKFSTNGSAVEHWFDGLAMLHAFSFNKGYVTYANKFLRTTDYDTVLKTGKMSYSGFAQDPCRSLFRRFTSLFVPKPSSSTSGQRDIPHDMPNANVNVSKLADHFVALTETPLPIEFDPRTLDTLGVVHYNDSLPESKIHESAHPHYDPVRKEHISYLTRFGRTSNYVVYAIKDGTTQRQPIASVEVEFRYHEKLRHPHRYSFGSKPA
jgi:beta,beta-carotene 9',10'-dioxygenase